MRDSKDDRKRDPAKHFCTLNNNNNALLFQSEFCLSSFKQTLKIWKNNPNMKFFYKNLTDIEEECKWQDAYIIHPFSFFTYVWEILQLCVILVGLFVSPVNYIYGSMISPTLVHIGRNATLEFIEIICDLFYFTDFLLILMTGFINEKKRRVYMSYKQMWRSRLRSRRFYIDIVSVLSITMIAKIYIEEFKPEENLSWIIYAKIASLTKIMRIFRFLRYFKHFRTCFRRYIFLPVMVLALVIFIILMHTISCFYVMIFQYIEVYHQKNDVIVYSFDMNLLVTKPFLNMYGEGHQTVYATILGIRRGSSYKYLDNMYLIWCFKVSVFLILSIFGKIIIAFATVLLLNVMIIFNTSETKYYGVINEVRKYMSLKRLAKSMQQRVINYYDYRFQRSYYKPSTFHENLSESLTREIFQHSCRALVDVVPLLKQLQQDVRDELITHLQYQIYLYNDKIINAGDNDTCMYFILRGSVAVYTTTGHEICHLQDGAYFGEVALILPGQKRIATVAAIEICEVYRLDRNVFFKCFDEASQFFKRIEKTARERHNKTSLLEDLHRKYLMDHTKKGKYRGNHPSHILL